VLGPVVVRSEVDPVPTSRVSQPRHLALLCYLALARPRGLQPRDRLIDLLWPNHDAERGRRALRNALHGVRLRLGETSVVSTGDQLVGLNESIVSCDGWDLERDLPWGREDLTHVVEPLQGLYVRRAPDFDHWLEGERVRLRALMARRSATSVPSGSAPRVRQPYLADAWALHARGHYLFLRSAHGGSTEDLLRCRDNFERALKLDETFAPALAGLANFHAVAARRGILTPFRERFAKAIELSERALAIDAGLAPPHVHFAVKALYLDDDFDRAGVEFETAVRKDPSYAEGHRFFGVWLGLAGRHAEALEHMEEAVALEPDVPHFLSSLGAARLSVGDRAGAEEALRRTLEHDRSHAAARARLIRLLEEDHRYEAAVEERARPPSLPDAPAFRAALDAGQAAYEALIMDMLRRECEELEARLADGGSKSVHDIFSPPAVRLVDAYLRLGDRRRAQRVALEARTRRPGLTRWLRSVPGL
jgi:hypothetical protein